MTNANDLLLADYVDDGRPHAGPGNGFDRVYVRVSQRGRRYRVAMIRKCGQDQGYLEVHRCDEVCAWDTDWETALVTCADRARDAGIPSEYVAKATALIEDEMMDLLCDVEEESTDAHPA